MIIQANIGETPTKFQVPDGASPADIDDVIQHYSQIQNPLIGAAKDIYSDTKEAAGNALSSTAKALSEPLNNPNAGSFSQNPILNTVDAGVRTVGKIGNLVGGATNLAFSPVTGALTASVANSGIIPAAAGFIKSSLVPDDPRFTANISPLAQHQVAQEIGGQLSNTVGLGMAANRGAAMANAPIPINTDIATQAGHNAYQAVADQGGGFSPSYVSKVDSFLTGQMKQPTNPALGLTKADASVNAALDDARKGLPAPGQDMTLPQWQAFDTNLGNIKTAAYQAGDFNTGRAIGNVQKQARDMVQPTNLKPSDLTGTPEGITTLTQDAIPIWAARSKVADIEQAVGGANYKAVPSTSIKNVFSGIASDADAMKQYPVEAQKAIIKAASTGNADDILGIVGSRLNPIAAMGYGGVPAAVASLGITKVVRGVRTAMKNSEAQAVTDAIYNPVRDSIEKYQNYTPPTAPAAPSAGPMLALPAPQTTNYVNPMGQIVPLTPAARDVIGQSASTASEQSPVISAARSNDYDAALVQKAAQDAAAHAVRLNNIPRNSPITADDLEQIFQQQKNIAAAKGENFTPTDFGDKLKAAMAMPPAQARKFLQKN